MLYTFQGGPGTVLYRFTPSAALWEGFIHVWVLRSKGRVEPEIEFGGVPWT